MLERWDPFRFRDLMSLPSIANAERVEASFDKGVLTIEVPKREEAEPRKITVRRRDE